MQPRPYPAGGIPWQATLGAKALAVLAASLTLAACGGSDDSDNNGPTPSPTPAPTPTPAPSPMPRLTVAKSGTGTVQSQPAGINCGERCEADFNPGTQVTLTATPGQGQSFSGWGGACSGSAATCVLTMAQARSVTAAFVPSAGASNYALRVAVNGNGAVSSQPAGISCGNSCTASFAAGTSVTLTAAPAAGQVFTGWGGACSGSTASCTVALSQDRNVVASFAVQSTETTWGNPQLLESSDDFNVTTGSEVFQLNAMAPNGNAIVIWQQPDGQPNGGVSKVYSRLYLAGQGWQPSVAVPNLSGPSSQRLVGGKLFLNNQGVATWVRPNLEARRYTAGSGWSAAVVPANKPSGAGELSGGVSDDAGNVGLVTVGSDVYNITLQANGQWGPWARLDTSGALNTAVADIARSPDGSAIAIWAERNPGDSNYSMKAARYDQTQGWQAPVTIDDSLDSASTSDLPRVAMDAAGNALAIWRQGNAVWVNTFSPATGWAKASAHDQGALSVFPLRIRLAMTPDGRAVMAWRSNVYPTKTMTFTPGSGLSAPVIVAPYVDDRELVIDDQGRATLLYTAPTQWPNPISSEHNLYAQRMNWGAAWGERVLLETRPGDVLDGLKLSANGAGKAIATWGQDDTAGSSVRNSLWGSLLQ